MWLVGRELTLMNAILLSVPGLTMAADVDPTSLLARVRAKVADNAKRVPRYVCQQRIERREFQLTTNRNCAALIEEKANKAGGLRLTSRERANLDVMLAAQTELFSWPGGARFNAENPGDLLSGGMSGSGDFASFVINIFTINAVTFQYEGACEGVSCVRFSYDVPLEASHYVLKAPYGTFTVGFRGAFEVDPLTADLLRVAVIPSDPDRSVPNICAMQTQMTYARAATEHGEFMLPAATAKDLLVSDGRYFENSVSYNGCREYTAESVVTFDDAAPHRDTPAASDVPLSLPAGTKVDLALLSTIDSDVNSAGDVIEAAIARNVRDASGQVLLHEGARVRGHLTQMQHRYFPHETVTVGIRFDTIVLDRGPVPLPLTPIGPMDGRGRGVFSFRERHVVLGKHFVSHWTARAPAAEAQ